MSKRKQELVNSDLASKKSLALPAAVAGRSDREIADEVGVTEHTDPRFQNCDEHPMKKRKRNESELQTNSTRRLVKSCQQGFHRLDNQNSETGIKVSHTVLKGAR